MTALASMKRGGGMKNLVTLVKMQLKEQLNFKRLDVENVGVFHIVLSILGAVLKFLLVTALCVGFLFISEFLGLFSAQGMPVPDTVISIVFSAMLVVSIFACVVGLTKSIYFARDNAILLTLPCTPLEVYLSKFIIFFIFEVKRNLSFLVPLFIAYYAMNGYGFWTYPWMLFSMIFVSLFTVSVGALLSIPAMHLSTFFRRHRSLQIASIAMFVTAAILGVFFAISLIPENIDIPEKWPFIRTKMHEFFRGYAEHFTVLYDLTRIFLGQTKHMVTSFDVGATALRFLVLVGAIAIFFVAGILIVKPLFYKMASTPFEYLKKPTKPRPNKRLPRRLTAFYNEFLAATKNSSRLFSNIGILVSVPMLIFLLNKIFLAMKTRELGDNMIIAFNILIILLVILNSNCATASIFSRDGRSNYLLKTHPAKYVLVISAKLVPNVTFVALSLIATLVISFATLSLSTLDTLMLMAALGSIYLAHTFYCAELDLMNPQIELYATVGSSESNPNETKATVSAFLISFATAIIVLLLLIEGTGLNVYFKMLFVSLIALVYRIHLFLSKIKLYFKEK